MQPQGYIVIAMRTLNEHPDVCQRPDGSAGITQRQSGLGGVTHVARLFVAEAVVTSGAAREANTIADGLRTSRQTARG